MTTSIQPRFAVSKKKNQNNFINSLWQKSVGFIIQIGNFLQNCGQFELLCNFAPASTWEMYSGHEVVTKKQKIRKYSYQFVWQNTLDVATSIPQDNKHQILSCNKGGNVLFNDALNTFYLRLYGVGHMVKDHSDSERKPAAD